MFTLSSQQDIEDFTIGCCFFGTGGGGNPEFGAKMLSEALVAGKQIRIVESATIEDNEWIICPYLMGTSGPETEEQRKGKQEHCLLEISVSNMPAAATRLLLRQHPNPIKLSGVISYELGGAATASAVATAAWLDVPTIDADYVGRSVPEAVQMLPAVHGVDLCPTASSDAYGNETIIFKTVNLKMTERIGKSLANASFGLIGQATLLHQAKKLKPFMLHHTLSIAFSVGKAIRRAREDKSDLIAQLNKLVGSQLLFKGVISKFDGGDQQGYYVGDIIVVGIEEFENSQLKIWFKNENIVAWLDNQIRVTAPDLISIVDGSTGMPYTNNQLTVGLNVFVIGTPSHPAWRDEKALNALNPRHFGLDFDAKFL